jgi:hypothetical protein
VNKDSLSEKKIESMPENLAREITSVAKRWGPQLDEFPTDLLVNCGVDKPLLWLNAEIMAWAEVYDKQAPSPE